MYQTHRMYNSRVNPKIDDGLWVIMVCSCRSIFGNKCTIHVRDAPDKGDSSCVRTEGLCKSLYLSFNFVMDV